MKGFDIMTFTNWLKTKEGFNSKAHYDSWLSTLPYEAKRKTSLYYKEKYEYFLSMQPKQMEFK